MKNILFILPLFILFLSCQGKQAKPSNEIQLDSLAERCYTLLMQLQTDSLRMTANAYVNATQPYSRQYYKAKQFYINAYFNEKDYNKVLSLINKVSQSPHFNDYPTVVSDYQYTRARAYQYSARYDEAIEAYKQCITADSKEKETQQQLQVTALSAMTQLMNTYVFSGKLEEGYRYFMQLKEHPTPLIRQLALRDLYIHLGYIAHQAGHTEESYVLSDSALILPLYNSTPEKLFRDYSYAAVVFYNNSARQEQVMQWLQQALAEAEKYTYTSGIEWSIEMLGTIYWRVGRIEEGTELYYNGLKKAKSRGDKGAECNLYICLSNMYKDWELYPQANDFANQAIDVIRNTQNNQFIGLAFNAKASVMKAMAMPDSAIYYYQKAENSLILANQPIHCREVKANKADLIIEHHTQKQLAQGVQSMREILQSMGKNEYKGYYHFLLGKGLIKQGKITEGKAMLDSVYTEVAQMGDAVYADGVLEYLIDFHIAQKEPEKVMQYVSSYRRQTDMRYSETISRKITSAVIQYQTEKKEQQLKLAKAQLSIQNLQSKLYAVVAALLLLVLFGGILWYLHQRKLQLSRQLLAEQEKLIALRECELAEVRLHEQEQILTNALENLRDVNHQSEQIREQLDEFLSDQQNLQRISSITPSLFREEGEVKFRRYFSQLHSGFLPKLREVIPQITRNEEILCMLIVLEQNMDQISDILCIEKKSVKMSRYRLRKKVSLEEEDSLDDFIKGFLK